MSIQSQTHPVTPIVDPSTVIDDWRRALDALINSVKEWAGPDWATRVITKRMEDSKLGEYDVKALHLQHDLTRVLLEPITRYAPGTEGVVDLYKLPLYDDIATLYRVDGIWWLHYAFRDGGPVTTIQSGSRLELTQECFRRVLNEIAANAV